MKQKSAGISDLEKIIRIEEIFFYLFFAILLFAKGIGLYEGMKWFTPSILAALFCFALKICLTEHTVGELVRMAFLALFGFIAYRTSGEMAAFIYVLVVIGMKNIPVKRVFQVGAVIWTVAFFATTIQALTKQIPDLALVHSKLGLGHIIRWSLGYPHPNVLHISYVILLAFYFYLAKMNRRQLIIASIAAYAFNFYIFLYSVSYTGLILTSVYLMFNLYFNIRKKFTMPERILIQCVFPVCMGLSVLGPVFIKGRLFEVLNKMMNTRWNLSKYFLTEQEIHLFGTRMINLPENHSIDCSYVYVLMNYGVVLFILMSIAYILTIRYEVKEEKRKELAIMLGFLVAGMSEPFMANLSFKNLTLLFLGEYYYREGRKSYIELPLWNQKIKLLPWAGRKLVIPEIPWKKWRVSCGEAFRKYGLRMVLAGMVIAVVSGGSYYRLSGEWDHVYVDVGLSDYWSGDTVTLKQSELPEDFNSLIIGSADGQTEMYVLSGNIVKLEHFREAVSVGLAGGLAGLLVLELCLAIKTGKKKVG